jgi:uncharacterized protein YndB with AHSA1/START domain
LEAANLVTTVRRGREKLHYLNAAPINEIEQRWINHYDRGRIQALGDLKHALEGTSVENRQFVYTTYINATPELLWKGLTDPAFTNRYWGLELVTDWKVGSPITWEHHGVTIADPAQVVLEADPFRRLAYTWHSFTPEWADAYGVDEQRRAQLAAETRSQAAFDIEAVGAYGLNGWRRGGPSAKTRNLGQGRHHSGPRVTTRRAAVPAMGRPRGFTCRTGWLGQHDVPTWNDDVGTTAKRRCVCGTDRQGTSVAAHPQR